MKHRAHLALAFAIVLAGCSGELRSGKTSTGLHTRATSPREVREAQGPSYETIVDLIGSRKLRSIDALLAQPEFSPAFRRGFTAVFRSKSIQYADPLNPRILLYGEDAKLVLAFTCATGDCVALPGSGIEHGPVAGGNDLELVQWRDATKSFEYRSIAFPEAGDGDVVFSDANPMKCLGCHKATDPRPNFEPYDQWPGMYGGNDDGAQPGILTDGESRDTLDQFLATGTSRPRYRRLQELAEGYQYIYDYGGVHSVDARTAKYHNIDLNEALYLLNDERIVDRIRKLPFYDDIKYALVVGLAGAPFSDPLRALGQDDLAALVDDCASGSNEATRMIQLLHGLGVDSLPWFMSFKADVHSQLVAPAFSVEGQVTNGLVALDGDLAAQDADARAKDGWAHLLATHSVRDGLAKCAAEQHAGP
jgi:hypothetical protein